MRAEYEVLLNLMAKKRSYARRLGIHLASKNEKELFKWFLACLLFAKPIQTEIAERAPIPKLGRQDKEQGVRSHVGRGLPSPSA